MGNMRRSFPEKSEAELKLLCQKFYHYFCDIFLETFKTLTISKRAMLEHCSFDAAAEKLLNNLAEKEQSIILVMGHKGNWEWAGNTFSLSCKHQLYVIYHPLANKYFDALMYKMRTRFGTKLIAMKDTFREMAKNRSELNATAFIADQTPQPDNAYWTTFLNQDTPIFWGTERIATKMKRPVLYLTVRKVKRGYYKIMVDKEGLLFPEQYAEGQLTEAHTRKLEEDIYEQPETWLWSHRRWKHNRIN
jgi:KDO2-lipid IV(A) lauroyltransferase